MSKLMNSNVIEKHYRSMLFSGGLSDYPVDISPNFCCRVYPEDPPLRRLRGRKGVLALSVASERAGSQRETKSEI